ncbi:response regulator transcription factor [Yimella radicis]
MTEPITVVVADDQPIIRDGFAAVLDSAPDLSVVGRVANGQELVDLVLDGPAPDVAVVDIRMPLVDGITAAARISDRTKVLILTTFDLHDYVLAALAAGAHGFLLKDVTATHLIEGVRAVAAGSMLLGPTVTRGLVDELTRAGTSVQRSTPAQHGLTGREGQVLRLLARGMSNAEIAATLVVGQETVKSHVSEILRKLSLRDRVQAVVYAYRNGLADPCGD